MIKKIILRSIKVVLLLFVLVTILLPLFNIKPSSVVSDSMHPTIKKNSLVYIKYFKEENNDFKIDDIVLIKASTPFIHRIINKDVSNGTVLYETKGDHNDTSDGYYKSEDIIGVYLFQIPLIGILFNNSIVIKIIIGVLVIGVLVKLFIKVLKEE